MKKVIILLVVVLVLVAAYYVFWGAKTEKGNLPGLGSGDNAAGLNIWRLFRRTSTTSTTTVPTSTTSTNTNSTSGSQVYNATPDNYKNLPVLKPGDVVKLQGIFSQPLVISGVRGTADKPIVIEGGEFTAGIRVSETSAYIEFRSSYVHNVSKASGIQISKDAVGISVVSANIKNIGYHGIYGAQKVLNSRIDNTGLDTYPENVHGIYSISPNSVISGNIISRCLSTGTGHGRGVAVHGGSARVSDNEISGCEDGVSVYAVLPLDGVDISGNNIHDNSQYGISVRLGNDGILPTGVAIGSNRFSNNPKGNIWIHPSVTANVTIQ